MNEKEWDEAEGPDGWTFGLVAFKAILTTIVSINPDLPLEDALEAAYDAEARLKRDLGVKPDPSEPPVREPEETDAAFTRRLAIYIDYAPSVEAELPHRKINAIKELRRFTMCGLKEAKEAVEMWMTSGGIL